MSAHSNQGNDEKNEGSSTTGKRKRERKPEKTRKITSKVVFAQQQLNHSVSPKMQHVNRT